MAKRQPKPKPAGASAEWVGASVRTSDEASKYTLASPLTSHVARGSRQQALICARINTSACAAMALRFYAKGTSPKSSASRKRWKYLTDPRRVGKAAEHAIYAGDAKEVESHPVKDLLHRPNPWTLGSEFMEFLFLSWEVTGNFFSWYSDDDGGSLFQMLPQYTRVCPSETGYIGSYLYFRDTTDVLTCAPEDVMHGKLFPSITDPYYGMSPIQACAVESDLTDAATTAEWYRWMNGGRPDYVVTLEPGATKTELDQVKAELARQVRGVRKTGTQLVLSNAKVVNLGWAPKEMEYTAGMGYSDERVQNAYGVPQSMVKLNDANLASAKTGNAQHARQTVLPRLCRMADHINEWLIPRMGFEPGSIWCAFDDPVMEDEAAESTRRVSLCGAGLMTWNEGRAEEGLEPYEEEIGDVPRVNGVPVSALGVQNINTTATTITEDRTPQPEAQAPTEDIQQTALNGAQVTALADLASQVAMGQLPSAAARAIAVAAFPAVPPATIEAIFGPLDSFTPEPPPSAPAPQGAPDPVPDSAKAIAYLFKREGCKWYGHGHHIETKDDDRLRLRKPAGVPGLTAELASELEKWYADAFKLGVGRIADGMPVGVAADDAALNKLLAEYLPKILAAAAAQGAEMIPGGSFDVLPDNALGFLQGYQVRLATQVAGDVTDGMNDALSRGLSEGLTTRQIADSLRDVIPDASQYRAERVARTESAYVLERGRLIGWQANGVEEKEWLLSGNPCALCEEIAGRNPGPIPVNQPFFEGGWTDGQTAPAHPSCACSTAAVFRAPPETAPEASQ